MRATYLLILASALAGQVYATVNVTVGSQNMTAGDLVSFGTDQSFVNMANCTMLCGAATNQFSTCGSNDQCVCGNATAAALLQCEQCLFNYVIDMNIRPPNALMGSQPALAAFSSACLAPPYNTTLQALKLVPPPSWDGPQSNKLSTGGTVVAVTAAALLGSGALFLLSTIE